MNKAAVDGELIVWSSGALGFHAKGRNGTVRILDSGVVETHGGRGLRCQFHAINVRPDSSVRLQSDAHSSLGW